MPNQIQLQQARSADSFVDTIGTNLHLTAKPHRVDYTLYESDIKPRLIELGLRHARQGAHAMMNDTAPPEFFDRINELGRAGIKFNFIFDPRGFNNMTRIPAFASKVRDGLGSFEGANEYDKSGVPNWVSTLRAFQESLYKSVKSNSTTASFPVLGPTFVYKESFDQLGDLSAFLDYGSMHNYLGPRHPGTPGWGANDYGSINWNLSTAHKVCGTKPVVSTETGYSNVSNSIPEVASAKYMPRLFLEHFNRGIPRTYNYEFIDGGTNPNNGEDHFGLLRNDGSPKPAYIALKNLISLLKDPGASFTPGSLDYTLSGNTMNLHRTLLQKRDGRFYLILWVELPSYDVNAKQQIAVSSQQVTLSLNTPISKAITYLPNTSTTMIAQYLNQKQLVLNVPDHPLVVELIPAASAISDMGLKSEYYDNMDLTNLKLVRTDATVDFDWGTSSPDPSIGADTFSVRWTGQLQPKYSEIYTFYTTSSDGVRLWVDSKLLIDKWINQGAAENRGTINLTAGQKYDIKMEYYENTGGAVAKLAWSSSSQAKEIVPQNCLYLPIEIATGLKGEYYDNMDLTSLIVSRIDSTVNFDWGNSSPDSSIGVDSFSVRWTGQLQPKYSETYTFYTTSSDGVRLWVDSKLLIDKWINQGATENRGTINLTAGQKYDIKMEYYENTGGAVAKLAWSSPSQAKEIVPQSQLSS